MSTFGDLAPDRIWWCHVCSGGVGVWGLDRDEPPPRCPECHGSYFAPVKFVPEVNAKESRLSSPSSSVKICGKIGCDKPSVTSVRGSCTYEACEQHRAEIEARVDRE